jgi:hypothetical protein
MTTFRSQTLFGTLKLGLQAGDLLNCILLTMLTTKPTAMIIVPSQRRLINGNLRAFKVRYWVTVLGTFTADLYLFAVRLV